MKPINMTDYVTKVCMGPKFGVNKAEHIALKEITVQVYQLPPLEPWPGSEPLSGPTAYQAHLTDISEIDTMHRAAVLNYKLSGSRYDEGRMDALRSAFERLKERSYAR